MSANHLPTPYELASIAATLLGREKASDPVDATTQAFALWRASTSELERQQRRLESEELERRKREQPEEEREILIRDEDGRSPAMDWVNGNADYPRENFKSERQFWNALKAHDPNWKTALAEKNGAVRSTVGALKEFLDVRVAKRRRKDVKRKTSPD